jgi:hypothetical protein
MTPIQRWAGWTYGRKCKRVEAAILATGFRDPILPSGHWTAHGLASQMVLVDHPVIARLCDPLIFGRPRRGPRREAMERGH